MPAPAAVVFDNDGLLLDTELAWTRAEEVLFGRRNRTFTRDDKRYLIGSSRAVAAGKLTELLDRPTDEGEALMDELHDLVMAELLLGVEARPGAIALLRALQAEGTPIGLATNSARDFVDRALAHSPIGPEDFGVVVSAAEVAHPKPAPDVYLAAAGALGADPAACVALEDSPSGVRAAAAAGMLVIGVPYLDGIELPEATLLVTTLEDPRVHEAVGLT